MLVIHIFILTMDQIIVCDVNEPSHTNEPTENQIIVLNIRASKLRFWNMAKGECEVKSKITLQAALTSAKTSFTKPLDLSRKESCNTNELCLTSR